MNEYSEYTSGTIHGPWNKIENLKQKLSMELFS